MSPVPVTVVAADHPCLDGAVEAFVGSLGDNGCTATRRRSARNRAATEIGRPTDGFRLAAIEGDRVVGLARVGADGDVLVVVAPDRRTLGIGTALMSRVVDRARRLGYDSLTLRGRRHGARADEVARHHGAVLVRHRRYLVVMLAGAPVDRAG